MDQANHKFTDGRANPAKDASPIRSSEQAGPDAKRLEAAALLLGRPVSYVDSDGYECVIIGAAVSAAGDVAYVESRAKEVGQYVDISIRIHVVRTNGSHESADIESYNPYFGCDVEFFEWIDANAILIYTEKHWTFACRFGEIWPPTFVKIDHDWVIDGSTLAFKGFRKPDVGHLSFPELNVLDRIPLTKAVERGYFPRVDAQVAQAPQSPDPHSRKPWWRRWLFK